MLPQLNQPRTTADALREGRLKVSAGFPKRKVRSLRLKASLREGIKSLRTNSDRINRIRRRVLEKFNQKRLGTGHGAYGNVRAISPKMRSLPIPPKERIVRGIKKSPMGIAKTLHAPRTPRVPRAPIAPRTPRIPDMQKIAERIKNKVLRRAKSMRKNSKINY